MVEVAVASQDVIDLGPDRVDDTLHFVGFRLHWPLHLVEPRRALAGEVRFLDAADVTVDDYARVAHFHQPVGDRHPGELRLLRCWLGAGHRRWGRYAAEK